MSISRHSAVLLAVANPALICTVMRSNESLQASRLMNWNHCGGRNAASSTSDQASRLHSQGGRGWEEGSKEKAREGIKERKEQPVPVIYFLSFFFFILNTFESICSLRRVACAINLHH